ncbi:MAG: T9SS type A sorting domain-containing protein [Vicingaceae bacterium]
MKNLYTLLCLLTFSGLVAQDTTSFRMIGLSEGVEIDFFFDDSTSMGDINTNFGSSGHAIFVNPADSLVYALIDLNGSGDRNLYTVNPFNGTTALAVNFTTTYFNSADIADNGKLYLIEGVAGGNNGAIHEYDLSTNTDTVWTTIPVGFLPRGLEYNPVDSSIYVFRGYSSSSYKIDLATVTTTNFATTGMSNPEIHGGYFAKDAGIFFLCDYYGEMYVTDSNWNSTILYHDMNNGVTANNIMDLTMFPTIKSPDSMKFCPGDSGRMEGFYSASGYTWYKDGQVVPGLTGRIAYAKDPGVYRALIGITMAQGTNYMWTEPIVVENYTQPNFNITNADNDTLICPNDTIVLNGNNGFMLQWYRNGTAIAGATAPQYNATMEGSYNMYKTNMSLCSDSAKAPYVIYPDTTPACYVGIANQNEKQLEIYPNPVNDVIYIRSAELIDAVEVYNLEGKMLFRSISEGTNQIELNFTDFEHGSYYVRVQTGDQVISKLVIK